MVSESGRRIVVTSAGTRAAGRLRRLIGIGLASMAAASLAACGVINPLVVPNSGDAQPVSAVAQAAPTVAAKPRTASNASASPRSAVVKKDAIVETVSVDGQVAAQEQVPITYSGRGQIADVKVKAGQIVA